MDFNLFEWFIFLFTFGMASFAIIGGIWVLLAPLFGIFFVGGSDGKCEKCGCPTCSCKKQ